MYERPRWIGVKPICRGFHTRKSLGDLFLVKLLVLTRNEV